MVGACVAFAMAAKGFRVALVEAVVPREFDTGAKSAYDLRVSAISPGSRHILEQLGIHESYGRSPALPHFDEPAELVDVGPNIIGKIQRLTPATAEAWTNISCREPTRRTPDCSRSASVAMSSPTMEPV